MGIPKPGEPLGTTQSTFSDDLLSIELCGPDKQNLSIIDIPGIFRTPTEGITTQADMSLVRRIMYRYISDERTIILAVIPSNTDIATQEILTIAKEVDPKGLRTLGVLTKPDLIDNGGEENVMMLVEGKRNPLRLGYHIVRNRGQSELSSESVVRAQKERDFFMREPWSRLERHRVGTPALQQRLQDLLVDITRREFPKVQAQITRQLASCRLELEDLGVDRQSSDQQRRYLLEISNQFQSIVNSGLDANYSRQKVFTELSGLRLATLAVNRMGKFSEDIDSMGHTVQFNVSDGKTKSESINDECVRLEAGDPDDSSDRSTNAANTEHPEYPELEDFIPSDWLPPQPSDRDIMDWIEEEHKKARSFGLGMIGPAVIPTLWQEQTKNWEGLTMNYIRDIVFLVHDFICKTLAHVCVDERVRTSIWSVLQEHLIERYQQALSHAKFILRIERQGTPLTNNHYFSESLQERKTKRFEKFLRKHAEPQYNPQGIPTPRKVVQLTHLTQSTKVDNLEHTVQQIHDTLESYYTIARMRFVDTVCMQGSDYYLLTGELSPLRVFGTTFVSNLSVIQLDMIAGEETSTKLRRSALTSQISALEKGMKLLRA